MPGRYKFPRAARLTRKSEYEIVLKNGERVSGRAFVCYWIRREAQGCKLGMTVSRKVGNAVVRNRIKRHIREFFRTHHASFCCPVDLAVIARASSAGLSGRECGAELHTLLQRGGIMHG
ncbi:MAG TPA: ribonuclease P protein component [Candidatus Hydrogenedentes bacterium]|nr:ribonuclease P protein component [Candidatus Hydrogenedentota bacterium]